MERGQIERLITRHKDSVYRQMIRVCGHREDAEDALSSAILQALKAADQLGSEEAFRAWIGTIGRRVCTRMRAHPGLAQALEFAEEHHLLAPEDGPNDVDLAVLKGCVRDAVAALPVLYRPVYEMCEIEERTLEEAAQTLDISLAAAKSRLHRARALVRSRLDGSICAPL